MTETKHQKYIRMVDARLPKAIHAIELLENLASTNYENTPEDAQALVDALEGAVTGVRNAFGLTPPVSITPAAAPTKDFYRERYVELWNKSSLIGHAMEDIADGKLEDATAKLMQWVTE